MKDAGTLKPEHVSMAKRNNVWVARECAKLDKKAERAMAEDISREEFELWPEY